MKRPVAPSDPARWRPRACSRTTPSGCCCRSRRAASSGTRIGAPSRWRSRCGGAPLTSRCSTRGRTRSSALCRSSRGCSTSSASSRRKRGSILLVGGRVEAGWNFNVVPAECRFTVDRRTDPGEDFDAEKQRLLAILDAARSDGIDLDVRTIQEGRSSTTPRTEALAHALSDSVAAVTGDAPLVRDVSRPARNPVLRGARRAGARVRARPPRGVPRTAGVREDQPDGGVREDLRVDGRPHACGGVTPCPTRMTRSSARFASRSTVRSRRPATRRQPPTWRGLAASSPRRSRTRIVRSRTRTSSCSSRGRSTSGGRRRSPAVPTAFRVRAGRSSWYAPCAWDAFGVPAALDCDARVEASCAWSGEPIPCGVEHGRAYGDRRHPSGRPRRALLGRYRLHLSEHPALPVGRGRRPLVRRSKGDARAR